MNPAPTISEAARRAMDLLSNCGGTDVPEDIAAAINRAHTVLKSALDSTHLQPSSGVSSGTIEQIKRLAEPSAHPAPKEGATPETDAAFGGYENLNPLIWRHARSLELRLSEAKRDVEDYKRAYNECWAGSPAVKAELDSLRSQLKTANELLGAENDRWVFLESLLVSIPVKFQAGRPPQYVNLSRKDVDSYRTHLNQQSK